LGFGFVLSFFFCQTRILVRFMVESKISGQPGQVKIKSKG
jgi:hypothetical protein